MKVFEVISTSGAHYPVIADDLANAKLSAYATLTHFRDAGDVAFVFAVDFPQFTSILNSLSAPEDLMTFLACFVRWMDGRTRAEFLKRLDVLYPNRS